MKKNQSEKNTTDKKVAPGMDPDEALGEDASKEEINAGEYTEVTQLSYNEYDPSEE